MFALFAWCAIITRIGAFFESIEIAHDGILCQNAINMKKTILLCTLFASFVAKAQVPGTLDSTFGDNGAMHWAATLGVANGLREIKLLPDGRFLAAGEVDGSNIDMIVAKFKANGKPDSSLQGLSFSMFDPFLGADDYTYCIDVLPDGKILLGGYQAGTNDNDVIIYKINTDGSIDNTWGNNGRVMVDAGGNESAMKIKAQPDGKILIGCTRYTNSGSNMFIVRLLADGTPDNSFSSDGISPVIFLGQTQGNFVDMEVLPSGNIIVCGTISDGVLAQVGMAKLNSVGLGMPGFGVSSKFKFAMDGKASQVFNMIRTSNSKMLLSCTYNRANNDKSGVLLMVDTNGVIDNVFGANKGVISYDMTNLAEDEQFTDVMEMKNGNFFVLSNYEDVNNKRHTLGLMFDPSGNPYTGFGSNGHVMYSATNDFSILSVSSIVPQPDGKVLIAGNAKNTITNETEFLVYRLNLENKATSGIAISGNNTAVSLYPNPASAYFKITGNDRIENVMMYDATGKQVAQWNSNTEVYTVPENVANGLYYIKVKFAENYSVLPVHINR